MVVGSTELAVDNIVASVVVDRMLQLVADTEAVVAHTVVACCR